MNFKTFFAMLHRDAHVARRNFIPIAFQTLLQPMMFVFIFGRVMTTSGFMPPQYKSLLLPGIIAISMEMEWLAVQKVVAGMIQALVAGLVVIPAAWLVMGSGVALSAEHLILFFTIALLVSLLASAIGLTLGCSVGQQHVGLMFSLVLAPMIFFGCTYYPWQALQSFPVLKRVVLINPLVYASEGFRSALVPQFPHLPSPWLLAGLLVFNGVFLAVGLRQFRRKALT
jgi:ABC-2 type transport system permease protein